MHPYSVIVVAHDHPRQLLATLLHLRSHAHPAEVIVIDNASETDLTGVIALSQLPVTVLRVEEDHPLGAAINLGVDAAAFDYVFVLHSDVLIETDPACAVAYLAKNPAVGIVGAKLFMVGNEPRKIRHLGYRVDDHRISVRELGREKWDTYHEPMAVSAVSTACMALRRTDLRFDERYWFDLEDVDFGLQHTQRNLAVVMHPTFRAVHLELGGIRDRQTSVDWGIRTMASRWLFHERWCSELPIDMHPPQPALRGSAAIHERDARATIIIGTSQTSTPAATSAPAQPSSERT